MLTMGKILSNLVGLGRHAECNNCSDPIAEGGNKTGRWIAAPVLRPSGQTGHQNADGTANLDSQKCNDSADGKHRPAPGSLW